MTIYAIVHSFNGSPQTYHGFYSNEEYAWYMCINKREELDDMNYTVVEVEVDHWTL